MKRRGSLAELLFKNGPFAGKSVALVPGKPITIGRDREVELPLADEALSRRHCTITFEVGRCIVEDLNSVNGTFVNGTRVTGKAELLDFDRVFFGSTEMEFRESESA